VREIPRWFRGQYNRCRVDVPGRILRREHDPVITATLLRGYANRMRDIEVETVDNTGHWIVDQRPELMLRPLYACLREH
jgi:pimeloyl-ACP methyl ester carboxylesterase